MSDKAGTTTSEPVIELTETQQVQLQIENKALEVPFPYYFCDYIFK
jgi:hypothetical protein